MAAGRGTVCGLDPEPLTWPCQGWTTWGMDEVGMLELLVLASLMAVFFLWGFFVARARGRSGLVWGLACGLHRVERLMKSAALRARPKRRRQPHDVGQRLEHTIAPNILDRAFVASSANQKWVADFTYIWTGEGWLYVAVVIDLYSRRAVGWSMSSQMTAQLVTDALLMAIWRRGSPRALLHHSDQGSQYTSEQFQRLLTDHGVMCSMSKRGDCWDNAAMESFFSSLKTERVARTIYRTRDDAKADVFDWIERFYNPKRRHSTLGYLSPMQFEQRAKLA